MASNVIALIPARGGSKRLPKKNVKPLNGKPLISWSIEQALNCELINQVIVSSDCLEILALAETYPAVVTSRREDTLASDTATTNSVILSIIEKFKLKESDILVLLQPTSPLRGTDNITNCISKLLNLKCSGVVSVTACEHSPLWANILPNNMNMATFIKDEFKHLRSQDLPQYYRLNGSIYAYKVSDLLLNNGITYHENVYAYFMENIHSIDIDTPLDFKIAECIMKESCI